VAAIPITADGEREPDEYFYFTLANATGSGAIVLPSFGSVTIHDTTPPVAPDTTPPAGSLSGVPAKMRLKDFLRGVVVKVDRADLASISATLEGRAKQAKLAAAYNLSLASKKVARAAGISRFRLKPSRRLVGKATKLTARVRVALADAAGNRRTLSRTIKVRR